MGIDKESLGKEEERGADYKIRNANQAEQWIIELIEGVEQARKDCTVSYPGDAQMTARMQKKAYHQFMVRHGGALGALMAFHRAGYIGDSAFHKMKSRVLSTLVAQVVGEASINLVGPG